MFPTFTFWDSGFMVEDVGRRAKAVIRLYGWGLRRRISECAGLADEFHLPW